MNKNVSTTKRPGKYEFSLLVEKKAENKDSAAFKTQIKHFIWSHNQQSNRVQIEKFLFAEDKKNGTDNHVVYVQLDETKTPADYNYFYQWSHRGCRLLREYGWNAATSSIKNPKVSFINMIMTDEWELIEPLEFEPDFLQIPN